MTIEWIIGTLSVVFSTLLGIVYALTMSNSRRLVKHDILFATFANMDSKMDELSKSLEKHEDKEDLQFEKITHRLDKLDINVALLKKSPNGDE